MVMDIKSVKNAIVYERVGDDRPKRSSDEVAKILQETNTDLLFRSDWRWLPKYNKCSELTGSDIPACEQAGMSYEILQSYYSQIHAVNPNTIIVAAIPLQHINSPDRNEITGGVINANDARNMALNPQQYGFDATIDQFQQMFGGQFQNITGYFPDINNPEFQELLMSWVKKQIDAGVDAIWFDLLFYQASYFLQATCTKPKNQCASLPDFDFAAPAVQQSFYSAVKIVDDTHSYAQSVGKKVYVGSWANSIYYSQARPDLYIQPTLDFVTITTQDSSNGLNEFETGLYDDAFWSEFKTDVSKGFGNIPIFVFLDWGFSNSPTEIFARMSTSEQQNALVSASQYFKSKGIVFVYPVHGGTVATGAASSWNDIISQNYSTYNIIKQLMTSGTPPMIQASKNTGLIAIGAGGLAVALYLLMNKKKGK